MESGAQDARKLPLRTTRFRSRGGCTVAVGIFELDSNFERIVVVFMFQSCEGFIILAMLRPDYQFAESMRKKFSK